MLRPLTTDLFAAFGILALGAAAFAIGRYLHRLPRGLFRASVALGVLLALLLAAACVWPLLDWAGPVIFRIGGERGLGCCAAIMLLGIVWGYPQLTLRRPFLGIVVALVGVVLLCLGSGRLFWRCFGKEVWRNSVHQDGCLKQSTALTCSPAAAAMLLDRYGVRATEGEMAYLANTSPLWGTEARALADGLALKVRSRGWTARLRRASYDEQLRRGTPFVAHLVMPVIGGHALLVERLARDHAEVIDPMYGARRQIGRRDFESWWEGRVIEVVR